MRPLEVFERPHCACCGQLITWQTVLKKYDHRTLNFCGPKCVEVFDTYLLPAEGKGLLDRLDRLSFPSSAA
jgi:hypothetical protein